MTKRLFVIIIIALISFSIPNVYAEKTLGDLKNELAALKKEKQDNINAKNRTQAEINSEAQKISNAYDEVTKAENDIEIAKVRITESNEKINSTKEETSKLLVFYEIMQNQNALLDYISGATTMTDLLMRAEAVSQILEYNQNKLKELEELIASNEQLQIDLKKKEEELAANIKSYEASMTSLKNDLSSINKLSLDIDTQIKAQNDLINYYVAIGCKDNQELSACVDVVNNSGWLKPTTKGYISSIFGWRTFYLNGVLTTDFHSGIDIAGVYGGQEIYATASGTVAAVLWHTSCGGNRVFLHVRVLGQDYTVEYAHMTDIYVKVGDKVTTNTVVGTVGGGGATIKRNGGWDTCSTGYHLHYNVSRGFYLGTGHSNWNKYVADSFSAPGLPAYGNWYYSRY